MAKGTISFTQSATSGSYIDGEIRWESKPDASAGTSVVTASLYVRKANTAMTLTAYTTGTWTYKLTIDGATWTGSVSKSVLQDWVLLTTRTSGNILHGAGGSKSINISGSITAPSGTSFAGHSTSGNATVALDTITRATTIDSWSCSSNFVDGTIIAYYTPRNSSYYNRCVVSINVNGAITDIHTKDLNPQATQQWPCDMTLKSDHLLTIYRNVKNTASVNIRVTLRTYSDSSRKNQIGKDQVLEKTLQIPLTIAPKAALTVTPVNSNAWIKGKNIYVAGLSGATVALSAEPGQGAKLTSSAITYDGTTYDAGDVGSYSLNVATLKKPGNISFSAKATDSRGRTATDPKSITVLPYSTPAIHSVKIERGKYASGWTADDNGSDVRVYFITSLALADHANTYNVAFTLDGTTITPDAGNPEGLRSGIDYAFHFLDVDSEHSHTLMITATDLVGERGAVTAIIPTTQVTVDFKYNGKGIAFGKASEEDAFECAMDAKFTGDVTIDGKRVDVVVEEGEKDFWTYRKWSSGLLECWGITNAVTLSFDGTVGLGCWYGTTAPEFNFPTKTDGGSMFVDIPAVQQTCKSGGAIIVSAISHVDSEMVKLTYGRFYGGNDDREVHFHFYARGKWK